MENGNNKNQQPQQQQNNDKIIKINDLDFAKDVSTLFIYFQMLTILQLHFLLLVCQKLTGREKLKDFS